MMIAHRGDVEITVCCLHRADRLVKRLNLAVFEIVLGNLGGLEGGGGLHQAVVDIGALAEAELSHQGGRERLEGVEARGDIDGDHIDPVRNAPIVSVDGHEARAEVCDESRTLVGKVDDNHFIVMLFDVDMPKMQEMMSGPELEGLIKEHGIEQEMFAFSPMN